MSEAVNNIVREAGVELICKFLQQNTNYKLQHNIFKCGENKDFTNDIKSDFSLDDLNFDPAAIIGEGNGDWSVS